MTYRVGIIAIIQESNTFLPEKTTLQHFRQDVLLTGDAVRQHFGHALHEMGGFFQQLATADDVEAVPIFAARAYPFGAVTAETVTALMAQLKDAFDQAGELDGLLVAPHGATVSDPYPDFDGYWLSVVREWFGPDKPIIGTLDPHVNLSPMMVAATDALFAYRSNPHIDQCERGKEAATLMLRTLRGEVKPVQRASFPPMAINIERQCTSEAPLEGYCRQLDAVRAQSGILGVSLMLGFPYADVAEMGSAVLVVANQDQALAQRSADELGHQLWDLREPLAGTFISVSDAVEQAALLPGPVCLLDMGDNAGGGGPADGTWLAWELHQRRVGPSLVVLYDPDAVEQAEAAGVGKFVDLAVGGKTDPLHGPPLETEFKVLQIADGIYSETEARHGGFTQFDQGRTAIVQAESGLMVMLTSRRALPFSLKQLTSFGLDPKGFQILVAKGVNAPLAAYKPVCPSIIRVNTPGVTSADMTQLQFHHRRRPMFPFERETVWAK